MESLQLVVFFFLIQVISNFILHLIFFIRLLFIYYLKFYRTIVDLHLLLCLFPQNRIFCCACLYIPLWRLFSNCSLFGDSPHLCFFLSCLCFIDMAFPRPWSWASVLGEFSWLPYLLIRALSAFLGLQFKVWALLFLSFSITKKEMEGLRLWVALLDE